MKKVLASALTSALVIGAASTTFAATNSFSDVPTDHWAYDAVSQLVADNIVDGYGDGTFRGQRNITRYEMAQMIARAMAKTTVVDTKTGEVKPAPNVSASDKALIDRLAAEFSDELNNLGVRVANLERNADMVKWGGKVEYTYTDVEYKRSGAKAKEHASDIMYRLEPSAEVNSHWHFNARIDGHVDTLSDTSTDLTLMRAFAEGDYGKFNIKLGRQAFYTNEHGLVHDTEFTGANLQFGSKFKVNLLGGRLQSDKFGVGRTTLTGDYLSGNDTYDVYGVNAQYDSNHWMLGAGYYYMKSDNFAYGFSDDVAYHTGYSKKLDEDKASIWSVNAGYKFSDKAQLWGAYAVNSKADDLDKSWQAEFDYGNYDDAAKKGNWSVYAAYRKYSDNVSLTPTGDGVARGVKGWEFGANYAIMKNVGLRAIYADGKVIDTTPKVDYRKIFGRVEFFW